MGMKILNLGIYSSLPTDSVIDENTVLLLHCNGADESTVFTDASPSEHGNATVGGTAQVDTTNKQWGTGSLLLDGDSDYLNYANSVDWDICGSNTDDWTIDFWVKFIDYTGSQVLIGQAGGVNKHWYIINHNSGLSFFMQDGGAFLIQTGYGTKITDTNWHHLALCKVASKYAIYKDGTQVNYTDDSDIATFNGLLTIGKYPEVAGNYFNGNMDEIRIQHSNIFNANPNDTPNDTIDIPTGEYN